MLHHNFILFLIVLLFGNACTKRSATDNTTSVINGSVELQAKIITGSLNNPWEIIWGHDGKIWMTERSGRISRVDTGSGNVTPLITIADVKAVGEGGLLGMALHPDFTNTPHVFVAYNYDKNGVYTEKIVRYTYNGTSLINPLIIVDGINAASIHNGCRLLISQDLKLFITTGDAANQALPQNASALNGKVLRLNLDGSIPSDNPNPSNAIWSLGHRNAQGIVFAKGKLYSSEHGPSTDDEINIIDRGRNYGWPNVNGFCNDASEQTFCSANNIVEPIYAWTPTIAVCGMDYYDNNNIPQWKNSLLVTTLKDNTLYQLQLNSAGDKIEKVSQFYRGTYGRFRDVCVSPDGKVFICTSNGSNDKIIMISPK